MYIFETSAAFERGLIKKAGLTAARARERNGGRPKLISSSQESKLKLLIKDPNFSPKELQEMFGVSKATLYRYANLNNDNLTQEVNL